MSTPPLPRTRTVRRAGGALRLVAFGSSTTEGYGASAPERTYPAILAGRLASSFPGGVRMRNHGISGESCEEMDRRVASVLAERPDLVIWQTGSNDAARPVPLERFAALTGAGVDRLRSGGADLVLMDQQYCDALEAIPALPAYRDALHALAVERDVPLFPRYRVMRDWCAAGRFDRTILSPDGTHMADPGYDALAHAVADWLLARVDAPERD